MTKRTTTNSLGETVITLDINDTIEQPKWTPMTIEEHDDLNSRMAAKDRKVLCQICIITDIMVEATHTCETCGFEICDNESNHILDHMRIDNEHS